MHTVDALVSSAELSQLPIRLYLQVIFLIDFRQELICSAMHDSSHLIYLFNHNHYSIKILVQNTSK